MSLRLSPMLLAAAFGAALLATAPAMAQQPSGGASTGGADQGGTGAPGGGTGKPGAVATGHSAMGVGTSATPRSGRTTRRRHRHM